MRRPNKLATKFGKLRPKSAEFGQIRPNVAGSNLPQVEFFPEASVLRPVWRKTVWGYMLCASSLLWADGGRCPPAEADVRWVLMEAHWRWAGRLPELDGSRPGLGPRVWREFCALLPDSLGRALCSCCGRSTRGFCC